LTVRPCARHSASTAGVREASSASAKAAVTAQSYISASRLEERAGEWPASFTGASPTQGQGQTTDRGGQRMNSHHHHEIPCEVTAEPICRARGCPHAGRRACAGRL
jgi:hypothetical protein